MAEVCFQIDGEWLTDWIRNFYYAEDKSYEECKDKLCKSLSLGEMIEDEKEKLTQSIIFREKKFIGINNLDLIDDIDFDVYDYSRISRPKNFKIGEGVTGILITDGIFAECEYGGHFGIIDFVDNENQKCAGALVFSAGIPGEKDSAYVHNDEINSPMSKYQVRWYKENKKYLSERQIEHIEGFLKYFK